MMNSQIKVSVIIPVYNGGAYVMKAVQSILEQTHRNLELLICDDGSSDDTLDRIREAEAGDARVKVLVNSRNEGHIYTYNRLFFAASGDYIMVQDADDWSSPQRIEKQLQACLDNKADLCFCASALYWDSAGGPIYREPADSGILDIFSTEHYDPATVFFRKDVLQQVPGYHKYFDRLVAMDRYFILSCLKRFKAYYLNEPLYNTLMRADSDHRSMDERYMRKLTALEAYRLLKKQQQETGTDWLEQGREADLLQYEQNLLTNKSFISEKYRLFACIQLDYNHSSEGWRLLKKAIKLNPLAISNYRSLIYLAKTLLRSESARK